MKRLAATLIASLALQTFGAIAPWSGGPTLPAPSAYTATWTLWFMLGFIASFGQRARRLAGQFSVLVLTAQAVIGPYGRKLVSTMQSISTFFPANAGTAAAAPTAPGATG